MCQLNSVLLIDNDHVSSFHNEKIILRINSSAKVMMAISGREAISRLLQHNCADLILLDIKIPVVEGLEFIRAFNEHCYRQKEKAIVAILSTSTRFEDRRKIQKLGISHHIIKPLTEQKILKLMTDSSVLAED
jgi:YesN/AraC family two-component response regulator